MSGLESGERQLSVAFARHVLTWLQRRVPDAVEVTAVDGEGSEWYGSTDAGFDDKFQVDVGYLTADGQRHFRDVDGPELADLWRWVVSGFDRVP